jgi:hypothetical protein
MTTTTAHKTFPSHTIHSSKATSERVGVAFETRAGNLTILIGVQGDPNQKKYFAKPSISGTHEVFGYTAEKRIDFSLLEGITFRNPDRSLTLRVTRPLGKDELELPGMRSHTLSAVNGSLVMNPAAIEYVMRPTSRFTAVRKSRDYDRSYLMAH